MAETQCFFSRLVDGLAAYMLWQISVRRRTDWRWQYYAFSWYDQWLQNNATSSRRRWTGWQRGHGASSLGWLMVRLVTCNGESACVGGLIDGGNTMLFLGKIDGCDMTLLHLACWWWEGMLATRLVWQTKLTHAEIKHYTHVGIHNYYMLAITVIGTISFYRTEYSRKQYTVSSHTFFFEFFFLVNTAKLP